MLGRFLEQKGKDEGFPSFLFGRDLFYIRPLVLERKKPGAGSNRAKLNWRQGRCYHLATDQSISHNSLRFSIPPLARAMRNISAATGNAGNKGTLPCIESPAVGRIRITSTARKFGKSSGRSLAQHFRREKTLLPRP